MYNSEVKKRFVYEYYQDSNSWKVILSYFRSFEEAERKAKKDIAQMTYDEALAVNDKISVSSLAGLHTMRVAIKNYISWCRDNHIFDNVEDGILQVLNSDLDITPSILDTITRDDTDLILALKQVTEFDNGYFEPVFLTLGWIGLTKKEILALKEKEIDFRRRIISCGSSKKEFTIKSDGLLDILVQYDKTEIGRRDNAVTTYEVYKDKSYDTFIKRFVSENSTRKGKPISVKNAEVAISKLSDKYKSVGHRSILSYQNVYKSGRFYELYQLEESGVDVSHDKDAVMSIFNEGIYPNIMWFYRAYKKAFSL